MERIRDARNDEQKASTRHYVNATDSFMSGWGKAKGGPSYYCIACSTLKQANAAERWLKDRDEMKRVRSSAKPRYGTPTCGHTAIVPFEDTGAVEYL